MSKRKSPEKSEAKKLSWKAGLLAVALIGGGFFVWFRERPEDQNKFWVEQEQKYKEAMTNDTYGGATPQETLNLFIAALEAEDVELASKYFMLDKNLSRERWENLMLKLKSENNMKRFAEDLKNKAELGNLNDENTAGFIMRNSDGTIGIQIDLRLNPYSKIWKIESI